MYRNSSTAYINFAQFPASPKSIFQLALAFCCVFAHSAFPVGAGFSNEKTRRHAWFRVLLNPVHNVLSAFHIKWSEAEQLISK